MGFYATTEVKEKNRYDPVFCSDKPENRLVTAGKSGAGVPPAEKIRIEFAYDANGNITAYADTNAVIVAAYEYDPFGNTIAASGSKADDFAFRFSTKYLDPETDWYYYGHRYYSPDFGRWPSRDPIGERGGLNVYTGMLNALINLTDAFGLQSAVRWNDVYQGAPAKFNRSDVDLAFSAFQPIVANRVEELRNLYGERLDNIAVSPFGESGRVTAFGSIPPFVDETPDRQWEAPYDVCKT